MSVVKTFNTFNVYPISRLLIRIDYHIGVSCVKRIRRSINWFTDFCKIISHKTQFSRRENRNEIRFRRVQLTRFPVLTVTSRSVFVSVNH